MIAPRNRKLIFTILFVLSIVSAETSVSAQITVPKPNFTRHSDSVYKVLFIGKLNTDCYDDTVITAVSKTSKVSWRGTPLLPKYILWGKSRIWGDTMCQDTTGGVIADSSKVNYSIIRYPSFKNIGGTVSFMKLNPSDSVYDIVSQVWGKTDTSTTKRDTSTNFVVFGRKGLDTLQILPFYTIDSVQLHPITAMRLRRPIHFTNPLRRDFSGRLSYILSPVVLPVIADTNNLPDTSVLHEIFAGLTPESSVLPEFKVFPNPSVNITTIVGHRLEKGTYTIQVLTETGNLVCTQQIISASGEEVVFGMDVSSLSTGYYILTITTQKGSVGSYPIVIIH